MIIYLVGGAVRDKILGLPTKDKDWVVVGSSYKEMIKLGFIPVGSSFPVFLHPNTKEEYALARTEFKVGMGYKGFVCESNSKISLEEDLLRRDLTMNAIAYSKGIYYDPYMGINDIKKKVIKHISIYFSNDPIRLLRVSRFYARFFDLGFYIHNHTLSLIKKISNSGELSYLTKERVWIEIEKSICFNNFSVFLYTLYCCNSINFILPEIFNVFKSIKKTYYFFLIFNKLDKFNYNKKIKFIFLFFFFDVTILSNDYFNNNIFVLNLVKKFCFKFKSHNKYLNLFIKVYNFFYEIYHFNSYSRLSDLFLRLFYCIDVWRNSNIINFILNIISVLLCLPVKNKKFLFFIKKNLYNLFIYLNNININKILDMGLRGKDVKSYLNFLRINKINSFINRNNFFKKYI